MRARRGLTKTVSEGDYNNWRGDEGGEDDDDDDGGPSGWQAPLGELLGWPSRRDWLKPGEV